MFASAVHLQASTANAKMEVFNTMGSPRRAAINKLEPSYTTLVLIIRCVR